MIPTMIPTNEKPRIGKCGVTRLWYCIKDHVMGRGTTPRGAFNAMETLYKIVYGPKEQK